MKLKAKYKKLEQSGLNNRGKSMRMLKKRGKIKNKLWRSLIPQKLFRDCLKNSLLKFSKED